MLFVLPTLFSGGYVEEYKGRNLKEQLRWAWGRFRENFRVLLLIAVLTDLVFSIILALVVYQPNVMWAVDRWIERVTDYSMKHPH